MWNEIDTTVGNIKQYLDDGYEIEVDSPDGWVPVTEFVDKGEWDEYVLEINNSVVRCNENHLFETSIGWYSAKQLHFMSNFENKNLHILTKTGLTSNYRLIKTSKRVPIVDIIINHPNHRYWTDGVSSHNTNVGKSFFMCHHAAACIRNGYNVLYITLEMSEERIAERIDCNLFDVNIDELAHMKRNDFKSKIAELTNKTKGNLVVKEYPTSSAHAGHFRNLLDELKLKKNFIPDIVMIDYLNICASQKYKGGASYNSYFAIKSVAEELRGLAVEYDLPILTATQTNRGGMGNTDIEMTDTSESSGTPMTLDFMFAMIRTEELDEMGQIMVKQLKSRFNDVNYFKRFVIGSDISKFKLYDVDQPTKDLSDAGRTDDTPAFDKSKFGNRMKQQGDFQELDFD